MSIDHIEADDAIAYLSKQTFKNSDSVTIMSADKDFLQLSSDVIKVWSPTKKRIFGCKEIVDEYGISCRNFILYRTLDGDVSDNVPGLKGVGLKTLIKAFPFLVEEKEYSLQELYNYSENNKGKLKIYDNVLDNKLLLERNYQLMQLKETEIQSFTQLRIEEIINKSTPRIDKIGFWRLISEDKIIGAFSQVWLHSSFGKLNSFIIQ